LKRGIREEQELQKKKKRRKLQDQAEVESEPTATELPGLTVETRMRLKERILKKFKQ
jgi:hypothetical protein